MESQYSDDNRGEERQTDSKNRQTVKTGRRLVRQKLSQSHFSSNSSFLFPSSHVQPGLISPTKLHLWLELPRLAEHSQHAFQRRTVGIISASNNGLMKRGSCGQVLKKSNHCCVSDSFNSTKKKIRLKTTPAREACFHCRNLLRGASFLRGPSKSLRHGNYSDRPHEWSLGGA